MCASYNNGDRPRSPGAHPGGGDYQFEDGGYATTGTAGQRPITQDAELRGHREGHMKDPRPRPQLQVDARSSEFTAPARSHRKGREQSHAPIVPAGSVTSRALTMVVSIMCCLACLTVGAVYMINKSADAWLRDIASEVTVQIEAGKANSSNENLQKVIGFLEQQPGISDVQVMSAEQSAELLKPWLGDTANLENLPIPRLLAIEIERDSSPDFAAIRDQLSKQFNGVTLDDHRQWQQQIQSVTRSFALGGLGILALVAAATTAIIITATRSAMASNREIVEVLHFVGATDRFIAHEFEKNFLRLGIRGGIVGAVVAAAVFLVLPTVLYFLDGGAMASTEMQRFVGSGTLDLMGYGFLGLVILVVAALCMLTSRVSVYRILNSHA
jgi:cell division transport system permease protein